MFIVTDAENKSMADVTCPLCKGVKGEASIDHSNIMLLHVPSLLSLHLYYGIIVSCYSPSEWAMAC